MEINKEGRMDRGNGHPSYVIAYIATGIFSLKV